MKNIGLVCVLLAVGCSKDLGVPKGYCEEDCVDQWTPSCEQRCGTPRPGGGSGGASGSGAGGGSAGAAVAGGGRGGAAGTADGGSGGNGGDAAVDGGVDAGGDGGASVECASDGDCSFEQPRCSSSGLCSDCLGDADCEAHGARERCDDVEGADTFGQCVECRTDRDCDDLDEPQCGDDGLCAPCDDDAACEDRGDAPRCDTDAGRCVECVEHLDCGNPTPQCSGDRACEACDDDDACDGRDGTEVCDDSDHDELGGTCVECTPSDFDCGEGAGDASKVCNSLTRECSDELEESADVCDECVSDAQCQPGALCVRQTFDDPTDDPDEGDIEIGWFCTWRVDAADGPDGDCFDEPPYVEQLDGVTSLDGTTRDVCVLGRSTCPAHEDFFDKDCAPDGPLDHEICGHMDAPRDGYCVMVGASTYRCTVPCMGDDDCPGTASTCPLATPRMCTL
jgi:hypothetical protein